MRVEVALFDQESVGSREFVDGPLVDVEVLVDLGPEQPFGLGVCSCRFLSQVLDIRVKCSLLDGRSKLESDTGPESKVLPRLLYCRLPDS